MTPAVHKGEHRHVVHKLGRKRGPETMKRHYLKDSSDAQSRVTLLTLNADC